MGGRAARLTGLPCRHVEAAWTARTARGDGARAGAGGRRARGLRGRPARLSRAGASERKVPTRDQWLADVKAAMQGARDYVRQRAAAADEGEQLAINFDIDNTVIATYYDGGGAIPQMARFSRFLQRKHVAMVFNTGRLAEQRKRTVGQLTRNGFPVADVCLRTKGETLPVGKQRCRDGFIDGRLHADRQRRQQRHRLRGRRVRAGLRAAELRRRSGVVGRLPAEAAEVSTRAVAPEQARPRALLDHQRADRSSFLRPLRFSRARSGPGSSRPVGRRRRPARARREARGPPGRTSRRTR